MRIEFETKNNFVHKPGKLFIASDGKVHILERVTNGENPAGLESEEYVAVCGRESQSWSIPAQNIVGAEFVASLADGENNGAKRCETCFDFGNFPER